MTARLADVIAALEAAYPPALAQCWDAVWLVCGDPADKVLAYCGEPASIERKEILRGYGYHRGLTVHSAYEVSVEIWTYNFGPHKLMYRLRFEDGLLIEPGELTGGVWHSYADHRMATAGAILGLRVPGVQVEDIATTSKTLPDFPAMWNGMLAEVR